MSRNLRRYLAWGAIGFGLLAAYTFATDGARIGWGNVDLTLLAARATGAGLVGILIGAGAAWFARDKAV